MGNLKVLAFLIGIQCVYCANILYIGTVPSPSHYIWHSTLALALVERGHNVTMLGHDSVNSTMSNYNIITFEEVSEILVAVVNYYERYSKYPIIWVKDSFYFAEMICKLDLETEGLKTLLKYPKDSFDIILIEPVMGHCLYPIIDIFNVSVIAVTPYLLPNYLSDAMGNHWYTSYMPNIAFPSSNRMDFTERVTSFFFKHLEVFIRKYYYMKRHEKLAELHFTNQVRPIHEYENEFSLVLANIDPFLDYPIALPPNIIPVGGLHAHPAKQLPKEFEDIMTSAKDGVILFSLGTNILSSLLPRAVRENIIDALGRLNQTVLWKFETEIKGLPKNVITKKWLPQNDLLGHPNMKMFISHGGALSTQEAIYHGVPVLGIPFYIDQINNVEKLVTKKIGLAISCDNIKANNLYESINELISNSLYSNNMKIISRKFRDQPQTASQRAVFWIEYVLKHGPLEEFALPTKDMNVFQIHSLDVITFFAGIIAVFLLVIRILKRIFCKKCIKKEKIN